MKRLLVNLVLCLALALHGYSALPWADEEDAQAIAGELKAFFKGAEVRMAGSPGNLAAEEKVAQVFASSGLEHGQMQFPTPVFLPGRTRVLLDGQPEIRLYPMHPSLIRPGNFKEKAFAADLVYLGRGTVEDLAAAAGKDLNGTVAVMEFDCNADWLELLRFGVAGFVFVGADIYHYEDSYRKVFASDVSVPRFFVSPEDGSRLKQAIAAAQGSLRGRIEAQPSRWENRLLRNLWALVPGADRDLQKEIVVITATLDANCVVPELATGAQAGANLHLLVRLLDEFRQRPPSRTVLVAALNAHTQKYLGERVMAWNLLAPRAGLEELQDVIASDLRVQQMYIDRYSDLYLSQPANEDAQTCLDEIRAVLGGATSKDLDARQSSIRFVDRDLRRLEAGDPALCDGTPWTESVDEQLRQCRRLRTALDQDAETALRDISAADLEKLWRYMKSGRDEQYLIKLRTLADSSTGKYLTIKEPLVNLAKREVNQLRAKQLRLLYKDLDRKEVERGVAALKEERRKFINVLTLFNKVGVRSMLSDLTAQEVGVLKQYVGDVIRRYRTWSELNLREVELNAANSRIRESVGDRAVKFVLTLEFVWQGSRMGFYSGNPTGSFKWQQRWGDNVANIAAGLEAVKPDPAAGERATGAREDLYIDAMTKRGGLVESYYFPKTRGIDFFHSANKTPAFAAMNVFARWNQAFSPSDTFDKLDMLSTARIMNYVPVLFRAMLDDRNLTAPSELQTPPKRPPWTVQVQSFKFDEFSASVLPELPVPHSLVLLLPPIWKAGLMDHLDGDVPFALFALTDERACATIPGIVGGAATARTETDYLTSAFHYDPDFINVDHAIDAGDSENRIPSKIKARTKTARLAMFECVELPIYARADSSLISVEPIIVDDFQLLDGKLNSAPKKYGTVGAACMVSSKQLPRVDGPAALFLVPGQKVKLLTKEKTLALNSTVKAPEGIGYASADEMGPDFFVAAARDMSHLNHDRLRILRGVSDELALEFLEKGDAALEKMANAERRHDHVAKLQSLSLALGAQVKAYTQTADITNDMLKAVVFYLALMLPFCFFVEKLLFKFVKIEMEMLMFGVFFVVTFLVFRIIHPAFRIAEAPFAMFVAFVMGGLGAFVIKILHTRFEGEMQLLFNTYAGMDTSEVGYSTVGQEAMLIGVNNMKRRRLRTTLTTATIVLVTFTMLAFTSISKKLSPTIISRNAEAPYTGLMYHWPGNKRMDEETLRVLAQTFAGNADVFVRRWLLGTTVSGTSNPHHAGFSTGDSAQVDAVLGLSARENGFIAQMPMRAGRFFTADRTNEVVLTSSMARAVGVDAENYTQHTVEFRGHEFRIAGLLHDQDFKSIKDLNQRPILPIKDLPAHMKQAAGTDESALDAKSAEEAGVFFVDMSALLLMPVETSRLFRAEPYSVSVRMGDDQPVWPTVDRLLTMTSANKFFIGSRAPFTVGESKANRTTAAGVYYVGEGYRTSIGGLSFLLIPLLIAATIILNTMLGSVFERKSEIAVYNAVGLNPTHIGMFFLAESFVYSVIGSVGGYLIGQILSIGLMKTGLVRDINLNFSSLSVVYVILFTVAIVLLSTIYPSIVATKAAVPSGKRKWSLPDNDGQTMNVVFPLIYQPGLIRGILSYLEAYFSRFTEASFGDLIALLEDKGCDKDDRGRDTYFLQYQIALAPFDLGVTQQVVFRGAYDERVQAYRIAMQTTRLSGQDTNWVTTNTPFLERLRTYLLHWRNLDASEHALYVQRADRLFGPAPGDESGSVTKSGAGESADPAESGESVA